MMTDTASTAAASRRRRRYAGRLAAGQAAQPIWTALRGLGTPFSVRMVADLSRQSYCTTRSALIRWARAGILSVEREGRSPLYTLVNDVGPLAPVISRDGAVVDGREGNERIWSMLRPARHGFEIADIVMAAQVSRRYAEWYISVLVRAGYVERVVRGTTGNAQRSRYRLGCWSGPQAPRIQHQSDGRSKQLYDPNLGEVVWRATPRPAGPAGTQLVWDVLRDGELHNAAELAERTGVPAVTVRAYLTWLHHDRVLEQVTPAKPGATGHRAVYRMVAPQGRPLTAPRYTARRATREAGHE